MSKLQLSTNSKQWVKAAAVRAVKTVAQTAVGVIGVSTVISTVDWKVAVSSAILAGIVSILTSIAGLPEVTTENSNSESEEN